MNTFALEIFDDEGKKCTFYTVRWDDSELSETDKFLEKYGDDDNFKHYIEDLLSLILVQLANRGALDKFKFRFENSAEALPPNQKTTVIRLEIKYPNSPLRLYCLRWSESLVVLFGGGKKTSRSAQEGETSEAFRNANLFTKRILEAIREGEIYVSSNGRKFQNSHNDDDEILL